MDAFTDYVKRMIPIIRMLDQLEGLLDTKDLTDADSAFLSDVFARVRRGQWLPSPAQAVIIEELYKEHFKLAVKPLTGLQP